MSLTRKKFHPATSYPADWKIYMKAADFLLSCATYRQLGTLNKRIFDTRTITGSELFSLLTCLHTTMVTLPSIFYPLEMNSIKSGRRHCATFVTG